jgi:hypothetical protein
VTSDLGKGSSFSFYIEDNDEDYDLSDKILDNLKYDCEEIGI